MFDVLVTCRVTKEDPPDSAAISVVFDNWNGRTVVYVWVVWFVICEACHSLLKHGFSTDFEQRTTPIFCRSAGCRGCSKDSGFEGTISVALSIFSGLGFMHRYIQCMFLWYNIKRQRLLKCNVYRGAPL